MADNLIYSLLLAGGAGTRLWPVSRQLSPKQTARFAGRDSLIQNTILRMLPVVDPANIRVVCGKAHCQEIGRHMEKTGIDTEGKIITEPCGRNTAPAILLALHRIAPVSPRAVVCVFPADHVIRDENAFAEKVRIAAALAGRGHIVTFGITPHYPETGYGYIEGGREVSNGALGVSRFVEKPDAQTARAYIQAGNFFWNSGMFAFRLDVMMSELERHAPDLYAGMARIASAGREPSEADYKRMPDISIDYAVMEKTDKAVVLPADFGWSDIGSWKSLFEFLPKDGENNAVAGDVITHRTSGCLILGQDRLIAVNHLKNVVVVETPDSVFVSDMDNSRDVKSIVGRLKQDGRKEFYNHLTAHHPWGAATVLDDTGDAAVTRLEVLPGQSAALRLADEKTTRFTVVEGSADFKIQGDVQPLARGRTFTWRRPGDLTIANSGTAPAKIIQITY